MFDDWSIKKIFMTFGLMLLMILSVQIYLFLTLQSVIIHFGISFIALFIALILFHSVNTRLKNQRKKR